MDWVEASKKLQAPFPAGDIHWRVGNHGKGRNGVWIKILAYIANRDVMDRLDDVFGPNRWKNEFTVAPGGGVLCGIAVLDAETGEWIWKWDGAENTDIEAVKGGLSDSMKRAAVQWGIGRYLYDLGETYADVVPDNGQYRSKLKVDGKEEVIHWNVPAKVKAKLGIPYTPPVEVPAEKPKPKTESVPAKKPEAKVTEPAKPGPSPSTKPGPKAPAEEEKPAQAHAAMQGLAKFLRGLGAMNTEQYSLLLLHCNDGVTPHPTWEEFKADAEYDWREIKASLENWLKINNHPIDKTLYDTIVLKEKNKAGVK